MCLSVEEKPLQKVGWMTWLIERCWLVVAVFRVVFEVLVVVVVVAVLFVVVVVVALVVVVVIVVDEVVVVVLVWFT